MLLFRQPAATEADRCFLDADNDVTATRIVKIVGKGADGVEGVERIPSFLELKAFPFNRLTV